MNKKWVIYVGALFLMITAVAFFIGSKPKIVSEWDISEKQTVLTNKAWVIEFSKKIDKKSVNENLIFVTNENGEKQDVTLSLSSDRKTITVLPPDNGYNIKSQYYTLHIDKKIKSQIGRTIQTGKEISFVVREDLPVVGTKEKLNQIFLSVIKEQKRDRERDRGFFSFMTESSKDTAESANDSAASGEAKSAGGQDFSETNNQVLGVDEADLVKTDGDYIYQIVDGKVNITKAKPAKAMKFVKAMTFEQNFSPSQLFLYKDQLVVIGHSFKEMKSNGKADKSSKKMMIHPSYFESTKAFVYDIKNPNSPNEIRHVELEGYNLTARRIDNYIYLVATHYPNYWIMEENPDEAIDLRPRFSDTASQSEEKFVDYDKIQYIPDSKETNYTLIGALNLDDSKKEMKITSYLGSGDQLYMSQDNIYLAVTNYHAVPLAKGDFLSPDTSVYKFTVNGDKVEFHSSAEVPGTILNQFSMDEYKGHFRVATTKGDTWNDERPSANNLYIFDENMKQVGTLDNLARGERIYSARFMQDRIYLVTFKQVDPLFVIDASNPTKPTILGELKIPGFSNYLHPYDENHLIGFGHDTKVIPSKLQGEEPRVLTDGVKISLFDISDVNNPKEKFSEVIGGRGTYSPLNYDHKALLFNKDKNIFAFPISIYQNVEGEEFEQHFEFQGAYVYDINLDSIDLKTKISHHSGEYEEWQSEIQRLLNIDNTLYAVSPTKVSAYEIGSYQKLGAVELK
ncbi:beta-propeller domain-containing protein [Fredinandcohnia quinoae]|uniref:Beta-propeller domain-containing protein n=1 Tax=Fredinandcohnia quinoae TaxID=2918902 RepID=A0AAW5E4C7_9BACI|nr:beta-propeller domain-containing protein [Fredinandcohnia sp. SECRCQ15]MCH1627796.1 beta-propeller domain-containing protein [Fredinandcohnia sp. SECRCQ15]